MRTKPERILRASIGWIATFAALSASAAYEPPTLLHSPSDDGIPHTAEFEIGPGAHDLNLWMVTGFTPTPNVPTQEVCDNGVGDEVCGLLAVITTTDGVTITSFTPQNAAIRSHIVSPSELRIVQVIADGASPGEFGFVRLGTLSVNSGGTGDVVLSDASQVVRADLELVGLVEDTIAVPEPARSLQLLAGLLFLGLVAKLRRRRTTVALSALAATVLHVAPADAQIYLDRTAFENAIGEGFQVEDFEGITLNGNGYAAFSNGAAFGGGVFTWESLATAVDVDLFFQNVDTGLDGTLLFLVSPLILSTVALPAGDLSGPPEANDDFELDFATPVEAAGLFVYSNLSQAGETIEFLDANGGVLVSLPLPANDTYVGYVATPGQLPIAKIRVDEDTGGDDIFFDDVIWKGDVEVSSGGTFQPIPKLESYLQVTPNQVSYGAGDEFGKDIAGIGDHNGDGVPDAAVGAPGFDGCGIDQGAVLLLFFESNGAIRRTAEISDDAGELSGPGNPGGFLPSDDRFGTSVTSLGDLDGDGIGDLAVGTQATTSPGDVYILFLREDGTVRSSQRIDESEGGFLGAIATGDRFGVSVAALGDLDGDGVTELAVGASRDDDGAADTGSVWVLFLDTDGTVKSHQKISALTAPFTGQLDGGDEFGQAVAGIGDLDRDGVRDLAVGARFDDDGGTDVGAAWIVFLNSDGTAKGAQKLSRDEGGLSGSLTTQFLGQSLDGGDHFGTQLEWIPTPTSETPGVLAVGAPEMETLWLNGPQGKGAIFFLTLAEDGTVSAQTGVMRSPQALASLPPIPEVYDPPLGESEGLSVAAPLGDIDGDGFPDVLAGAWKADPGGATDAGAASIWFLAGLDPTAYADAILAATATNPEKLLGQPDLMSVRMDGESVTAQFVDNFARGNGGIEPDLMIHRTILFGPISDDVTLTVSVSEDGKNFTQVFHDPALATLHVGGFLGVAFIPIDLDASGFGPSAQVRFVHVVQTFNEVCSSQFCTPTINAIEAIDNGNLLADSDFDGIPNGVDNCPTQVNPTQTDSDGDGSGDICDNCPAAVNADQFDGDGDGFGDLCDDGELRLVEISQTPPEWELRYRCPGDASIFTLNTGIAIPSSVNLASVRFGSSSAATACEEPSALTTIPNPPPGYVAGSGCNTAPDIGATIAPLQSGVIGPGLTGPAGVRGDTLYLVMTGQPGGICTANQDVAIGKLFFDAPPSGGPAIPALTSRGVSTPGLGLDEATFRFFVVNPEVSTVDLRLAAAPGQTPGAETDWEVCVTADGQINRLSFGLIPPVGTSTSDMSWNGCAGTPSGTELRRTCTSFLSQYGTVAPTTSCGTPPCPAYTQGPDDMSPNPVMHVVLEGTVTANDPLLKTLNPAPTAEKCVGRVTLNVPGVAPDLTLDGLENLPSQPPLLAAVDSDFNGVPDLEAEISTLDVTFASAAASSEDTDNDSLSDDNDNCPFLANTNQANTGGLEDSVGTDNIGDDCQCGDLDFDGRMLQGGNDLDILVDVLLGINANPAVLARASVSDAVQATIKDAVYLQRGLDGNDPGISQACEDGVPPVP